MQGELTLEVISDGGELQFKEVANTSDGGVVFDAGAVRLTIAKKGRYLVTFLAKDLYFLNPVRLTVQPDYPHWLMGLRSFTFEVEGLQADRGQTWEFSIPTTAGSLDPVIVNQVEGGGGGVG